jgi:hypothetical protein
MARRLRVNRSISIAYLQGWLRDINKEKRGVRVLAKVFFGKSQASFEYVSMVAIVLLFIVSGVAVIYTYTQKSNQDINFLVMEKIGNDMVSVAEKVYFIGGDSWETLRFNLPSQVVAVYVFNNTELVIEYDSYGGISQAVFFSDVPLTTPHGPGPIQHVSGDFHVGLNVVRITSLGGSVLLEEVG